MNSTEKTLSPEQNYLVSELAATYGIDPDEIIFYTGEPRPFFKYEATCVLCNSLTDLQSIDIEPINNGFVDSVSYRCTLMQADASTRSAVGVANVGETDGDGKVLTPSQLIETASGRAIRSALRVAGIDLLKLHNQADDTVVRFSGPTANNHASLLRLVHKLGQEAGLIIGKDKTAWHRILDNRYKVQSSDRLTEDQLSDFAAVLNTLVPQQKNAA